MVVFAEALVTLALEGISKLTLLEVSLGSFNSGNKSKVEHEGLGQDKIQSCTETSATKVHRNHSASNLPPIP